MAVHFLSFEPEFLSSVAPEYIKLFDRPGPPVNSNIAAFFHHVCWGKRAVARVSDEIFPAQAQSIWSNKIECGSRTVTQKDKRDAIRMCSFFAHDY
jgi:hypothetical protein